MKYRKITNQKSTVVHNNGQHWCMPTLKKRKKQTNTNEQTKHQKHDLSALIYIMDGLFNLMIF